MDLPHDPGRRRAVAPVVWLTGMSGAGKSTIAELAAERLRDEDLPCEVLDGDEIRANLLPELGFSKEDRDRNVRRVGFVAHLLARNGVLVLAPLISPYREAREAVRERIGGSFIEVHVKAQLEVLEARDTKGLYARARVGRARRSHRRERPVRAAALARSRARHRVRVARALARSAWSPWWHAGARA